MKFENRIQRYHHLFTKTDKQIVDYIQNNDFDDTFSTINSLAYAIKTSPATITRFSNKLNYDNFQDLKFNLQQEMTDRVIENSPLIQRIHKYHQDIIQPRRVRPGQHLLRRLQIRHATGRASRLPQRTAIVRLPQGPGTDDLGHLLLRHRPRSSLLRAAARPARPGPRDRSGSTRPWPAVDGHVR